MALIASCHCGASKIELPDHPTQGSECNCTFCSRTGAVWAYYQPGELRFLSREGQTDYSSSGDFNHHYFCGTCGMHVWGDSPDWSTMFNQDGSPKDADNSGVPTARKHQVNLRLVQGLNWAGVKIEKLDGLNGW
jgi:hypothetical protein